MERKLSEERIEEMAEEVVQFLIRNGLWQDVTVFFNGKAYSTFDGKHGYSYNDPERIFLLEGKDPHKCTDYCGDDILVMTFEGPLYSCIHGLREFSDVFEKRIYAELNAIFSRYGCYYELGTSCDLSLYFK